MPNFKINNEISLRQFELEDLEEVYKLKNDIETSNFLGGFSVGYSTNDIRNWIDSLSNRKNDVIWCIADKNNKCIGQIGLYDIDYRIGNAGIGIAITKENTNCGIGTKVHKGILEFAFNDLNLNKITAKILTFNNASIALYEKLGFIKEGEIRSFQYRNGKYINAYIYGLLKKEWKNNRDNE